MNFEKHIKRIGWLYLAGGGILLLLILYLAKNAYDLFIYTPDMPDDPLGRFIVWIFLVALSALLSVALIPIIVASLALLKNTRGGRTWGIAAGVCLFLFFPVGTAAAIYAFSFFTRADVKNYYLSRK